MMRAIVDQVAALAKTAQIFRPVIAGIVIEVSRGKHDTGLPDAGRFLHVWPCRRFSALTSPGMSVDVEPSTIRKTAHDLSVWSPAILADAARPLAAHLSADLRPVDRVEPSHLSPDRHWRLPSC